jgi:hypothetical protein
LVVPPEPLLELLLEPPPEPEVDLLPLPEPELELDPEPEPDPEPELPFEPPPLAAIMLAVKVKATTEKKNRFMSHLPLL